MNIPKLYRVVTIKFWSLRNGIGSNMGGVIFDCDTLVERKARRVSTDKGWKWQIKDYSKIIEWDWCVETDQEILDNYELDVEVIRNNQSQPISDLE